ncbi:MAG: RNA pseudouridine synthase [Verrucomicrobia bacterium]|nr:RNA pseudouridine synthase [Verrucomicrobiota bacterium]MDA1069159.1 RNA pseudouridine synthase [Verrucomicrobiota bacterium]
MPKLNIKEILIARHGELLVINKPSGWPTSGRSLKDDDCVQYHLMEHFGTMVWAVHQLDADTSGLCLFVLSKSLVTKLKTLWIHPAMVKEYYAIVYGEPGWDQIDERSPIGSVGEGRLGIHPKGKSAHTRFTVIDRSNGYSLIRAQLQTGRIHQIRIHLSHLGHPLVGEEWYRNSPCLLHPRQALHAHRLKFPVNEVLPIHCLTAPIASDLVELAERLGLRTNLIHT